MLKKVAFLQDEIASLAPERKRALLNALFDGDSSPDNISQGLSALGVSFPYQRYACVRLIPQNDNETDAAQHHTTLYNICYFAENIHMEGCIRLALSSVSDGVSVLVNHDSQEALDRLIDSIRDYIHTEYLLHFLFGVTESCTLLEELPSHYPYARAATEYRFLLPQRDIFWEKELHEWQKKTPKRISTS